MQRIKETHRDLKADIAETIDATVDATGAKVKRLLAFTRASWRA